MANTAFDHNPTITIPGSGNTTDNAVVLWNGTAGNNFSNSVVIINAGAVTGVTALTVDNININGNTMISTDSNGDINITPNGTGATVVTKLKIAASAGADKVLTSDSNGFATWEDAAAGGISNIVEDTSPELGGNLDVLTRNIVSSSNRNIVFIPNGTGGIGLGRMADTSAQIFIDQVAYTAVNGTGDFGRMVIRNQEAVTLDNNKTNLVSFEAWEPNITEGSYAATNVSTVRIANAGTEGTWNTSLQIDQPSHNPPVRSIAFSSASRVSHGVTAQIQDHEFGMIQRSNGSNDGGGLKIVGINGSSTAPGEGICLTGVSQADLSQRDSQATGGEAPIRLECREKSGNSWGGTSTRNLCVMVDYTSARFIFRSNGYLYVGGGYSTFSDNRLKFNQEPIAYGLNEILQLQPKVYEKDTGYLDENEVPVLEGKRDREIGFIAQEVRAIIPELVEEASADSWYCLDDGKLMAVVVKAIQELKAEIDALKA